MNSLYGYPQVGPVSLTGMGDLSGEGIVDKAQFVYNVATGEVAEELTAKKAELKKQRQELSAQREAISKLPAGAGRAAAERKYQEAMRAVGVSANALNTAIRDYNILADKIKGFSVGTVKPPPVGLAGMGAAPLVLGMSIPVFVIVASAAILVAAGSFALVMTSLRSSGGLLADTRNTIEAAGGAVKETGIALTRTAWAVGGLVAVFIGYQLFSDWRKRKRSSGSFSTGSTPVLDLKPVEGSVVV